jgi:hypothetical protein
VAGNHSLSRDLDAVGEAAGAWLARVLRVPSTGSRAGTA